MPEPNQDWFFQPRSHNAGTAEDTGDGLISLPAEVLHRHGARILDPDTAVAVPGFPSPRSTVYRSRSLLVPGYLQHADKLAAYNRVLSGVGMKLQAGPAGHDAGHSGPDVARRMAAVPRAAVLTAAEDSGTPVAVDAWVALQALRAAAAAPAAPDRPDLARLERDEVDQIALEHLLVGSAITGNPLWETPGGLTASPGSGAGPASTDSYLFSGGDTRTPVTVLMDPPGRELAAGAGRVRSWPSWTRGSVPIHGWTWRPRPGAATTSIRTTTATASPRSTTTSRRRSCSRASRRLPPVTSRAR